MSIISLPDELILDNVDSVQVFNYSSSQTLIKQQIVLKKNVFSFLVKGTKEVYFKDSTLSLDNTKFIIMKAGNCLMTEKLSDLINYNSVLLFFDDETLSKFVSKIEFTHFNVKDQQSVTAFDYDDFTRRFVTSLLDILSFSKDIKRKLLEVKLEEILFYLSELYGTAFLQSLVDKNIDSTRRFLQVVEVNKLNKLSLSELAFLANMSVSSFKREFEKHYKESPIKWFQQKRLEQAHYLLTIEKKNASEIYLEVGYESLSSFIQAYKLNYGITPKQHFLK